jgi:hypothetical protein
MASDLAAEPEYEAAVRVRLQIPGLARDGLRGKATAIDGVSSIRWVARAAKASGVNGSCATSTVITVSKPAVSAAAAKGPASRQWRIGSIVKMRIPMNLGYCHRRECGGPELPQRPGSLDSRFARE